MKMTGVGSAQGLGSLGWTRLVSEMGRRAANGDSVPVASAQPMVAPSTTTSAAAAAPVSSPTVPLDTTARGGITATHFRPDAASGPATAAPAPVIRPGPNATSGGGIGPGSGAASYGPTEYYGANGAGGDKASATEKKTPWLPIGLILWAIFGT